MQPRQPNQPYGPAPHSGRFEELGAQLIGQLVETMEEEHQKELGYIRQNKQMLQKELRRMVLLLQTELLPREQQLQEMLETLNEAYRNANKNLQSSSLDANLAANGMGVAGNLSEVMVEPMRHTSETVGRLEQLLGRAPVAAGFSPTYVAQRAAPSTPPARSLFDVIDRNNDGIVDQAEFQEAMRNPATSNAVFDVLDRNHDGRISRDELQQAIQGRSQGTPPRYGVGSLGAAREVPAMEPIVPPPVARPLYQQSTQGDHRWF